MTRFLLQIYCWSNSERILKKRPTLNSQSYERISDGTFLWPTVYVSEIKLSLGGQYISRRLTCNFSLAAASVTFVYCVETAKDTTIVSMECE